MASLSFAFPQPLVERYRPKTLAEFAGLSKPKAILKGWLKQPYPSNWLFIGPPGTGKTTMAQAIAAELGAELHHIPSQKCTVDTVDDVARRCWYVPMTGKFHVVLVDESDQMTPQAQLALLSKLDSTAAPPNTVWIFTANATDRLEARFLSRCRTVEFSTYGIQSPLTELLKTIWTQEVTGGESPNFARIAKETTGNVREALMRLETEILQAQVEAA